MTQDDEPAAFDTAEAAMDALQARVRYEAALEELGQAARAYAAVLASRTSMTTSEAVASLMNRRPRQFA
jgi:hypothetical protein